MIDRSRDIPNVVDYARNHMRNNNDIEMMELQNEISDLKREIISLKEDFIIKNNVYRIL